MWWYAFIHKELTNCENLFYYSQKIRFKFPEEVATNVTNKYTDNVKITYQGHKSVSQGKYWGLWITKQLHKNTDCLKTGSLCAKRYFVSHWSTD